MLTSDDIHRQIKATVKVYDEIVTGLNAQNLKLESALAEVRTEKCRAQSSDRNADEGGRALGQTYAMPYQRANVVALS